MAAEREKWGMSKETETVITVGLILFAILAWLWPLLAAIQIEEEDRKRRNEPPQYDERQRIARLRAGNHTLFVLLGFLGIWTVVDQFGWFAWTGSVLDMTLCALILSWGVWASECILHDAFITWKDKRKDANALALVYCWMLFFWTNPSDSGPEVCDSWMPFIFSCVYAVVLTGVVIYKVKRRKKAEIEDAP